MGPSGTANNQTWTYHDGQWTNLTASAGAAPSARYGMQMTYDAHDGYIFAFGGTSDSNCGAGSAVCLDSWTLQGGTWHRIVTAAPPVESNGLQLTMTYDATDSYVMMTNGFYTWTFSGGNWTRVCPSNCSSTTTAPDGPGVEVYDPSEGYVLFFGGATNNQTWTYKAGVWSNISASAGRAPSPRLDSILAYDNATQSVLLFGGIYGEALNDTWEFSNGSWSNVTASPAPPATYGGTLTFDPSDSMLLLFGGDDQYGSGGVLNDTWEWGVAPPIADLSIIHDPVSPLPNQTVSFSASFEGGVPPIEYQWLFGNGNASNLSAPGESFSQSGNYRVVLWLNDSVGHSVNATIDVSVEIPLEVGSLTASPNPAPLGAPVTFVAMTSGGSPPYTYKWAFGDGSYGGNDSTITHEFTTTGPFRVTLFVSDAPGEMVEAALNVSISLVALAGLSSSIGQSPLTVEFVGVADGGFPPYSYSWTFGDHSSPSDDQNPAHVYASPGTYAATLTVIDNRSERATTTVTVVVSRVPGGVVPWLESSGGTALAVAGGGAVAAAWIGDRLRVKRLREDGRRLIEELERG